MPRRKNPESVPYALYADLLNKYHALKVSGASEPVVHVPMERAVPDVAVQMAVQKSAGNQRLLQHYLGLIASEKVRGTHLNDIAAMIEVGLPDDLSSIGIGE